jgi:acyl carrier protein
MNYDQSILKKVSSIVHETFLCEDQVSTETEAFDIDGWDSLSHSIFILNIEKEFAITLPPQEALKLQNIGELCSAISEKIM